MDIVGRIRGLCDRRGISISKLEHTIGVGSSTIRRWEKNSPSVDKVLVVAKFFDVSVDYLLDNDRTDEDEAVQEFRLLKAGSRELSEEETHRMFRILKAFFDEE